MLTRQLVKIDNFRRTNLVNTQIGAVETTAAPAACNYVTELLMKKGHLNISIPLLESMRCWYEN